MKTIDQALINQKKFSDLFFDSETMTIEEKEETTKTFVLAMHAVLSDLVSAVNYKDHLNSQDDIDHHKILYKSADAFRYVLALLNLWGISSDEFVSACEDKDYFLHTRHSLSEKGWKGQPVILVDVDDVIAHFRSTFSEWLEAEKGVKTDPECKEYYNVSALLDVGIPPEKAFRDFIDDGGFSKIPEDTNVIAAINQLKDAGYWIHLVTARPSDNLRCLYNTYTWLGKSSLKFDAIDFSGEKFRWLADQPFYNEGKVVCAIDDSPKHSSEYAKHGVQVLTPSLSYNQELRNVKGVTLFDPSKDNLVELVESLRND